MKEDSAPRLQIQGHTATITLRRVREHNRIDPDDPEVILAQLQQVAETPGIAALVITGEGTRTFCAGYTLGQIGARLDRSFEDMLDRVESLALPTICALNGSVYGGGTDLAMCCDFRLGVTGMRMFMPAAKFGLHYYPGGLRRFVSRIGAPATKKLFLTGMSIEAEEMLRIGFLTEIVTADALAHKVGEYVDAIALGEAGAISSMKRHIDALARGTDYEDEGRAAYERSLRSSTVAQRLAGLGR